MIAELASWNNFQVMIGSAAGALIGLQFVVLTLIAQSPIHKDAAEAGSAFITPTIMYFGATLLVSALMLVPWQEMNTPAALLSIIGITGAGYMGIVALHMQRQESYPPNPEDWFFRIVVPLAAFALLARSLLWIPSHQYELLFGVGSAELLLLFVGIHNAWDTVTYVAAKHSQPPKG